MTTSHRMWSMENNYPNNRSIELSSQIDTPSISKLINNTHCLSQYSCRRVHTSCRWITQMRSEYSIVWRRRVSIRPFDRRVFVSVMVHSSSDRVSIRQTSYSFDQRHTANHWMQHRSMLHVPLSDRCNHLFVDRIGCKWHIIKCNCLTLSMSTNLHIDRLDIVDSYVRHCSCGDCVANSFIERDTKLSFMHSLFQSFGSLEQNC